MPSLVPERVRWAVSQLVLRPSDRVLEVGCGPGHAVALLCGQRSHRSVTAIDRSALQIQRARARNRPWIEKGCAHFHRLAIKDAPDELGRGEVDALLAVNVNAFWTAPAETLSAAAQLLAPKGMAYVVYEPPSVARLRALERSLPAIFADHGFNPVDVRSAPFRKGHGLCIIGQPTTK